MSNIPPSLTSENNPPLPCPGSFTETPIICVVRFAHCCQLNGSLHRSGGWSRWPHAGKGLKKRHPPMNQSNPINALCPHNLELIPSSDKLFFGSSHYRYIRGFLFLLNAFRLGRRQSPPAGTVVLSGNSRRQPDELQKETRAPGNPARTLKRLL